MENNISTKVFARNVETECPFCGEMNGGWVVDPRGKEDTCDHCGMTYIVAEDAEVKLWSI